MDGIFNIALSDSESDTPTPAPRDKASRTHQSEDAWRAVRDAYHVKVENGEVHQSVQLPLNKGTNKQQIQEVIHAAEELYFFRRFDEAIAFLDRALARGEGVESEAFDRDTRELLGMYRDKCLAKRNTTS